MRIVNSNADTVPYGDHAGLDLGHFAEKHFSAAEALMQESRFRIEFQDHYYDLELYLQIARSNGWDRKKRGRCADLH